MKKAKIYSIIFILFLTFAFNTTSAATLSSTQIYSLTYLLETFGVPESTIKQIRSILLGKNSTPDVQPTPIKQTVQIQPQPIKQPISTSSSHAAGVSNWSICNKGVRPMRPYTKSQDIKEIQEFLTNLGFFNSMATGFYGPATIKAVQAYQSARGIVSYGSPYTTGYGLIGPKTASFMEKEVQRFCTMPSRMPYASTGTDDADIVYSNFINTDNINLRVQAYNKNIKIYWNSKYDVNRDDVGAYIVLKDKSGRAYKSKRVNVKDGYAEMDLTTHCNRFFSDAINGNCTNLKSAINEGKKFYVELGTYTPKDACFGFCAPRMERPKMLQVFKSNEFAILGTKSAKNDCEEAQVSDNQGNTYTTCIEKK